MNFVEIIECGNREAPWHIRANSIEAVTDMGAYRVVQISQRTIHTKQDLAVILEAIKRAEEPPVASYPCTLSWSPSLFTGCAEPYTLDVAPPPHREDDADAWWEWAEPLVGGRTTAEEF